MKYFLICFALFTCCSFLNAQNPSENDSLQLDLISPKEYEIGGVTVDGGNGLDKNTLILLSGLTQGDKIQIPGDKVSRAIENLWKQGLFDDIKISVSKIQGKYIFLTIHVEERPRMSKFSFKGVSKSEADDIREKIKLIKGKVVTEYLLSSVTSTTKEHFVDKGYMNATVQVKQEKDTGAANNVSLQIVVDKGKRVRIEDILIHGNTALSDQKLRRGMKDTKVRRWYTIFNTSKYLEDNLQKDEAKIIEKYNAKGYRDAKIVKDTVYRSDDNRVTIELTIDEGRKYYFRNISWVGNTKYASRDLSSVLGIKKGDVFDQSVLDAKLFMNPNGTDVSSLYMDDGYLFFQISPVEIMVENDSIDLEIRIYEGKQAIINNVTVSGNTKTNDHVIMREIRTRPGQLFRRSDIIRTQRELSQLGYFDPEKLKVNPVPNPASGTVDIEYVVEEKPSDQIELSGGFGGGTVVGTLGVSFNNFSARNVLKPGAWRPLPAGDGQKLSVRAQSNGLWFQSYNASFTEPWLGGKKPNSLSVTMYHSIQSNGQKRKIDGTDGEKTVNPGHASLTITGLAVGFGKRLKKPDDYFSLYQESNFQHYVIKNNYGNIFVFKDGYSNNLSYKIALSRNSIDKPIFETRGSNITASAQLTPPYSLFNNKDYGSISDQEHYKFIEYQKYKFTAQWFTSLTNIRAAEGKEARNLVLNTKIGYGFLGMYNSKVGIAPFERFYLGGSGLTGFSLDGREIISLRGYDDQSLSPRDLGNQKVGAAAICKYTVELRYPITLNPQATIFILGFAEAGNSWLNFKDFNPFSVKRSAGVGARIFLPMFGLLGFDYGWRFDDIPTEPMMQKSQFHFTIGASIGEL